MTSAYPKTPTLTQRVIVSLILSATLLLWVLSGKFWLALVTFIALSLTLLGFSKAASISNISNKFAFLVAKVASVLSRILIQLIYMIIIAPLNFAIRKKLRKQYGFSKISSESHDANENIRFESYF